MSSDYNCVLQRFREERVRCGLTQEQLCRFVKIPQSAFSRVETGQRLLSYPELQKVCGTGMDIFYTFTGNRAKNVAGLQELPAAAPEELLCHLNTLFIYAGTAITLRQDRMYSRASLETPSKTSFTKIRKQLGYFHYLSADIGADQNIFYRVRSRLGYTQTKMAGIIGMDIKTLRSLEKGRKLPDSWIIWKMYDAFHVSPAFILMDAKGLQNELNYVLGLLGEGDRDIMLRIIKDGHDFMDF